MVLQEFEVFVELGIAALNRTHATLDFLAILEPSLGDFLLVIRKRGLQPLGQFGRIDSGSCICWYQDAIGRCATLDEWTHAP